MNIGGFLAPLICGTLGEVYGWHWGFGAAGVGMLAGLLIYTWGQRYLPAQARHPRVERANAPRPRLDRPTILLLAAVALAVTVFRGSYEQIGNTMALWADTGVDRHTGLSGSLATIPMTWFIALNPLLVMLMTPPLLAWWRRRAAPGREQRATRKMATGALVVGAAYLLLAALEAHGGGPAHWGWLVLFFVVFTLGELFILPTGLGLFARLAPEGLGATTVAAWYLATFAGSLLAGLIGALWSRTGHALYFVLLALIATAAAAILRAITPLERRLMAPQDHSRERL